LESIGQIVADRGITELFHFTTNRGLVGIVATKSLKARSLLTDDSYLQFIFKPNADFRRDPDWTRYVNLSISRVNPSFFNISRNWHKFENVWWCLLSFDPVIMSHNGVKFVTTNNMWSGAVRREGSAGLLSLFQRSIYRYPGCEPAVRLDDCPRNLTTCEQAEVLYPIEISTDFLRRVYFSKLDHLLVAEAQIAALEHPTIELVLAPELFAGE
jgi:hypothetical protein